MKHKIKTKAQQLATHPTTKKALIALKPERSIWGFLGIVMFLIVPEIVAFIWGAPITAFAKAQLLLNPALLEKQYYDLLLILFENGGSWLNLAIAGALLIWLFF